MSDPNPRTFFRSQADGMSQRFPDSDFGDIANPSVVSAGSRLAFLRRVYGWMFAAVVATVFGAGIAVKSGIAEAMLTWSFLPRLLLVLAWVGGMFLVQKVRHIPTVNVIAFAVYSVFTGFVLSTLIWFAMALAQANG
jgi:FtsH-binding integral membrane protein